MLRILLYIVDDEGTCMINRLQEEGHEVVAYFNNESFKELYDNLVNKVSSLKEGLEFDPDVIVFDATGCGEVADKLKKQGYCVFGGGSYHDRIENDRKFGLELMKKAGIQIPPTWNFNSTKDAMKFIQNKQDRYVLKLNETAGYFPAYVSKVVEDLVITLEHLSSENLFDDSNGFVLQKFIEGYEISIEGWFNGEVFLPKCYNHCLEDKNFMPGGHGPSIGNAGCIIAGGKNVDEQTINELEKLVPYLQENDYRGAIDIAFIKDKDDVLWALEFCARIGYVSIEPFMEVYDGDFGELLMAIASGEDVDGKVMDQFGIGVRLSIPPYPMEIPKNISDKDKKMIMDKVGRNCVNLRILGYEDFISSCYLAGIKADENGNWMVATRSGYLGAICARALTIDKAQKIVFERLDNLILPDKQYRIDIGDRAKEWFAEKGRIVKKDKE